MTGTANGISACTYDCDEQREPASRISVTRTLLDCRSFQGSSSNASLRKQKGEKWDLTACKRDFPADFLHPLSRTTFKHGSCIELSARRRSRNEEHSMIFHCGNHDGFVEPRCFV